MSPATTPISSSRSGERLFALLCVLIGGMGQGVVAPQLPRLLGSAGSLALESGISATILYFGIFLATFFYGNWADRGKVHLLLGFGLVGYAGTLLAMSASPGLTTFYLLRFIEGLTLSAVFVSADYLLGKLSASDERGRWLSYFGVAISAGLLLGPLLVLGMPASFGDPMQGVALAALACAVGTGAWIRVPRETSNTDERSGRSPSKSDARDRKSVV